MLYADTSLLFDRQHDLVLKKLNFDLLTPCSEKVEFRPFDPTPGFEGVSVGKIFGIMLLYALLASI